MSLFSFEVKDDFGAFYTGGKVTWSSDGQTIYCQHGNQVNAVTIDTVTVTHSFGSDTSEEDLEDPLYTFALKPDSSQLVTAHKSGLFKLWDTSTGTKLKTWKSIHSGPIAQLEFNDDGTLLASGGADSMVRVWDIEKHVCKGTMRGCLGVLSLLKFHPTEEYLLGAGDDAKIHCWDYNTRQVEKIFESHFAIVTGIVFTSDATQMVSCGRDKVLILWDFINAKQIRTIPVYEGLEALLLLPSSTPLVKNATEDQLLIACAGEEGSVKIWDMTNSKIVYKQTNSLIAPSVEKGGLAITYMFFHPDSQRIAIVSVDHNIIIHDAELNCEKQLVGFSDEILDLVLFNKNRYLAMATNSNDIKLFDVDTMNCTVLRGHTDIVLAVAARGQILVSSAKDYSIKVWRVDAQKLEAFCLGTGTRHTAAVGTVDLGNDFIVSASQDKCIKLWKLPELESNEHTTLICPATALAHDKDINSIVVAPNNKLIATGSQDKTAKLWDANDLSLVGVFRGHRRGIWTCRFSPTDQVLLTTAADCSMRLWSLTDLTCLKSLDGHESSVLRAEFLSEGMQIISTGADGLLKLWNIKTSVCIQTLDKHDGRVWALAVSSDEQTVFSGGADSLLVRWSDVTEQRKEEEIKKKQQMALEDQELSNLIHSKKLLKALKLALRLDRPHTSLTIINEIIKNREEGLQETILSLNDTTKVALLNHANTWNTNARNYIPAQLVLSVLLDEILTKKLKVPNLEKIIEEMLPYTERHYNRIQEQLKDMKFVEYSLKCMRPFEDITGDGQDIKMEEDSD